MTASSSHLEALCALLPLDRLPRTGWILRGVGSPESVAGHLAGTAYVALALAGDVDPPLDLGRVLAMALLHDAPEAVTGDLPRGASSALPDGAKAAMEDAVAADLVGALGSKALDHWNEYQTGDSREARFVHLCDKLQLGVQLVGYLRAGQRGLGEFVPAIAALDCGEFPSAARLQSEVLAAIAETAGGSRG